jgi:putative DNA primase/helicase
LGIALWGGNKPQSFEVWQGAGSDGKSALALMIQGVLGDSGCGGYAASTKSEVIMSGFKNQNPEGASPFLVLLKGARIVFASETKDNSVLNEALVKQLTGGEKLLARANYQAGGSFKVDFTLFLLTNPMPNCSSLDNALLTRINIMPFKVRWQRHGEVLDDNKHLPLGDTWWVEEAMEDEGVRKYLLRWLIEGCVEYMREGFGEVPTRCFESLGAYKEEADTIATWMDEREVVLDGGAKTLVGDLYASYKDYALGAGHYVLSTVSFVRRLTAKYPDKLRKEKIPGGKMAVFGIEFKR